MKTLKVDNHTFEIVDKVPKNYMIWNIGNNMPDGYLPLCELLNPEDPDNYSINPETLKAVQCEGAQAILKVTIRGQNTIKKMETYIKRYSKSKNSYTLLVVERMKEALKWMYTLKFE